MHRFLVHLLVVLALLPLSASAQEAGEPPMSWPDAAELLTRERLSAEACTRVIKRFTPDGDRATLATRERDYEAARGLMNGLIANLQVALVDDQEQLALASVETRIEEATAARRAYCATAEALLPPAPDGGKGLIGDIVAGTIGELIKAAVTLWRGSRDDDRLRRNSIKDALEDTKWPAFATIEP
ncbi:MAG TPA: hypothetical protein PLL33_03625 [Paracoccus sp. (in: a-proteobacteria)]|nr:hypothetical protein [Paracoccus sp. (in: a-proteobacteria)]